MTAYARNASGDWATTTAWTPNGRPGAGDTATIGNFAVTVTGTEIIGTSGLDSAVAELRFTSASGGSLTIAAGGQLNLRCNVDRTSGVSNTLCVNGGGILEIDPSAAADPAATYYKITGAFGSGFKFQIAGTSKTNRGIVRAKAGSAAAGQINCASYDCLFGRFTRVGRGDADGERWGAFQPNSVQQVLFEDCVFDTCGKMMQTFSPDGSVNYRFKNCTWVSTAATNPLEIITSAAAVTATIREIKGCVFDKAPNLFGQKGYTIGRVPDTGVLGDENYFMAGWANAGTGASVWGSNFIYVTTAGSIAAPFDTSVTGYDTYFYKPEVDNPHFILVGAGRTYDGWILEAEDAGVTDAGDGFPAGGGYSGTGYFKRCMTIPDKDGDAICLASLLGNSTTKMEFDHCTIYVGKNGASTGGGINIGETYTGTAGMIPVCKNSIGWTATANGGTIINDVGGTTAANLVTLSGVKNNGKWNLRTGVGAVNGYDFPASSTGTAGVGDVTLSADPFTDRTRNMRSWGASLGATGTDAEKRDWVLAEFKKKNDDAGYNTLVNVAALLLYVRAGFKPTALDGSTLRGAADDLTDIGAVQLDVVASGDARRRRIRLVA